MMLKAGLDEAGRGAFFGRVYSGIVIIAENKDAVEKFKEKAAKEKIVIRDSKKMTALQRNKARKFIEDNALAYAVEYQDNDNIDTNGILKSTMRCFNDSVRLTIMLILASLLHFFGNSIPYILTGNFITIFLICFFFFEHTEQILIRFYILLYSIIRYIYVIGIVLVAFLSKIFF